MSKDQNENIAQAERIFKAREEQKADAPKATADYYAAEQRIRDRTRELRQERLAREALQKKAAFIQTSSRTLVRWPIFRTRCDRAVYGSH